MEHAVLFHQVRSMANDILAMHLQMYQNVHITLTIRHIWS